MTRFEKKFCICPGGGKAVYNANKNCHRRSFTLTIFLIVPILLFISSVAAASENDDDLKVECIWESDLFITYNDFGVRISESDISPNITITNDLEISIRITTVAVHTDWQEDGENYYSWVLDGGSPGQELKPGESLNVKDVWMHLDPDRLGQHDYSVIVDYLVGSEKDTRSFSTSDRSDLKIEFDKGRFIVSFLRGSDVMLMLIPVIILGLSLYEIQRYREITNGSEQVERESSSDREDEE